MGFSFIRESRPRSAEVHLHGESWSSKQRVNCRRAAQLRKDIVKGLIFTKALAGILSH
jgi:hypothetical protein